MDDIGNALTVWIAKVGDKYRLILWNGLVETCEKIEGIVFRATIEHQNFWQALSGTREALKSWKQGQPIKIEGFDDGSCCWPVSISTPLEEALQEPGGRGMNSTLGFCPIQNGNPDLKGLLYGTCPTFPLPSGETDAGSPTEFSGGNIFFVAEEVAKEAKRKSRGKHIEGLHDAGPCWPIDL